MWYYIWLKMWTMWGLERWLRGVRVHDSFAEDPSSVPSARAKCFITTCNSSSWGFQGLRPRGTPPQSIHWIHKKGEAGKMVQWWRSLALLPENLDSDPALMWGLTSVTDRSPRWGNLSPSVGLCGHCMCRHTCWQNAHTHKTKIKERLYKESEQKSDVTQRVNLIIWVQFLEAIQWEERTDFRVFYNFHDSCACVL